MGDHRRDILHARIFRGMLPPPVRVARGGVSDEILARRLEARRERRRRFRKAMMC